MEGLSFSLRLLFLISCTFKSFLCQETVYEGIQDDDNPVQAGPTVMIAVLVRNKAHILPWFLHYLQELQYPKDRLALWIRCDHSSDDSAAIVQTWLDTVSHLYHSVDFQNDDTRQRYEDETGPCHWSEQRFEHVVHLRQQALDTARMRWADTLFMLDADCLLLNSMVLSNLLAEQRTVVAPMLNNTVSQHYSNFWCGMDSLGYYKRTSNYLPILQRHVSVSFPVAMVHSAVLINLRHDKSRLLNFDPPPPMYAGPVDDIIIFAQSAKHYGVSLHIVNRDFYGFMQIPMEPHNTLDQELEQFAHIKNHAMLSGIPLKKLDYIDAFYPASSTMGFDQIYMINLERRPDRRENMDHCFQELGIQAKLVPAVDGRQLNDTYLDGLGIKMLENFADPYHKRPLTMGEIGCFLSHYFIWQDILKNNYEKVIVFEDDIRFKPFFKSRLRYLMYEIHAGGVDWDLLYLGRKRLKYQEESWVEGAKTLVYPHYSYWTLSYALTHTGASKLLDQQPLSRMVPVDEYLPIMFDRHPTEAWKEAFSPRDLISLSAEPLLVEPTHYTGEPGYITDTENSDVIKVVGPELRESHKRDEL